MKKIDNGELYDLGEYFGIPEDAIEWLCQSMVGKAGRTLIIGLAKTGKTILAIILGLSIAKGSPVLGYPTEQCRVLYIVLERWRDFRPKLKEIAAGDIPSNFKVYEHHATLVLDDAKNQTGFQTLEKVIQDFRPDVVILDSRYKTTTKKEVDEEAAQVWIKRIEYFIDMYKCSFVVIHHSPKMEYEDLVNRAAGTSILARWADVIIGIRRSDPKDRKNPYRILEFVSNAGGEPDPITVKITNTGMEEGIPMNFGKFSQAFNILDQDLKDNPNISISKRIRELSAKHGIGERTFWQVWSNVLKP